MKPIDQSSDAANNPVDRDADMLTLKYGDCAETYAQNRAEAAKLRGADMDAKHWSEVEEEVAEDREAER